MYYKRIDLEEGIDLTKSTDSEKCIVCHYWLCNHGFIFQNFVCNGCHDLTMLCLGLSDISIIVRGVDYCCIITGISKFDNLKIS